MNKNNIFAKFLHDTSLDEECWLIIQIRIKKSYIIYSRLNTQIKKKWNA